MKIAICVSGQLRTAERCIDNIKGFFGPYWENADVFLHTWDVNTSLPLYEEPVPHVYPDVKIPLDKLTREIELFSPKLYEVQDFERFKSLFPWNKNTSILVPFYPFFYSWLRSVRMMRDYENITGQKYHVSIKIRPDVIYEQGDSFGKYLNLFSRKCNNTGFVSNISWVDEFGIENMDDIVYLARAETMYDVARKWWYKYSTLDVTNPHTGIHLHGQFRKFIREIGYDPIGINDITPSKLQLPLTILRDECNYPASEFQKCFDFEHIFFRGDRHIISTATSISTKEIFSEAKRLKKLRGYAPTKHIKGHL
jgi:hypothetical protein